MKSTGIAICLALLVSWFSSGDISATPTSDIIEARPINFHAEREIFLSAEILNPGTDHQTLKVVLPDSSVLYKDLTTQDAWKEAKVNGPVLKSSALTDEELRLLNGLDLDTDWFPANFPVQLRFLFKISEGRLVVDIPGEIRFSYDASEVVIGQQLDTWLEWVGDEGGGNLHMEAEVEVGAMYRAYPPPSTSDQYRTLDFEYTEPIFQDTIPYVPIEELGLLRDCGFTPFLLDNAMYCTDIIDPYLYEFPEVTNVLYRLRVEAELSGEVEGELSGQSICANGSYCVYDEGASQGYPVEISDAHTNVPVTSEFSSAFHMDWIVNILPGGCVYLLMLPIYCLDPGTETFPFTLFDQDLVLDFNEPSVSFEISQTAVQEIPLTGLPEKFAMSQNFPNPFNPSTTFEFSLPTRSQVEIEIFNILGRRVKTLHEGELAAGTYTITWDGRDDGNRPVATGVYLYRLKTDAFIESRKMVLLK